VIVTLQQPMATPYTGGPRTGSAAGVASNRLRPLRPTLLRTQFSTSVQESQNPKKTPV